jgi:malic enzyme
LEEARDIDTPGVARVCMAIGVEPALAQRFTLMGRTGALAAGSREISTGMKLAAARAIASLTQRSELVPDALDPAVHAEVTRAVEEAARAEGLARPERVPTGL